MFLHVPQFSDTVRLMEEFISPHLFHYTQIFSIQWVGSTLPDGLHL